MQLAPSSTRLPGISVWLPALAQPDTAQPRQPQHPQELAAASRRRSNRNPSTPSNTPDAPTLPTPNGVFLPAEAVIPTDTPTPSGSALNLTLSRKDIASVTPRSFAEQSSFRGRLPKTVERQIANAAAESGPWIEERIDNDRIRMRRGNTCVMMERPRAASLDPMNEASARMPWRASQAGECSD